MIFINKKVQDKTRQDNAKQKDNTKQTKYITIYDIAQILCFFHGFPPK